MTASVPDQIQLTTTHEGPSIGRRDVLSLLGAICIGTATFQRALADEAAKAIGITVEQIAGAEWIAGISLTEEQRTSLQAALTRVQRDCAQIRAIPVKYDTLPAFRFDPEMADTAGRLKSTAPPAWLKTTDRTEHAEEKSGSLSFLSIRELGRRLRAKEISSVELTRHCLDRLIKVDPVLNCVITLTKDLAIRQAEQADHELAQGQDRGPLHGIPWGAKDLIAVSGYPTTWGAPQFRTQQLRTTATVARRLEDAGAVLVAKLSLGALAMGDQWFMGQTKNPWNPQQGSSGSSAGSASAVAAGLIPFAVGSETLGSIISPARRCGVTGLRPTFGRVSRAGCMALSWTMDKIGPIARSADDCGQVLAAIHGTDAADPTTVDRWFRWPVEIDLSKVRIGHVTNCETAPPEQAALDALKELGANIVEVELPRDIPEWALAGMLDVEAACVFHELAASGNQEGLNSWPAIFQRSHFVSAVDYLLASQARFELMKKMTVVFRDVDLYVGGNDLGISNLTGHPMIALPVLMKEGDPQPRPLCCTLTAGLYDEATLLAVAALIERHVDVLKHEPQFGSSH